MIAVATADFEVYHDVVEELRDRNVRFGTIEPGEELPDAAAVNIARTEGEEVESRDVEPTVGEIRIVQERSRERGDG